MRDVLAAMERIADGPRPLAAMAAVFASLAAAWVVYVPIHELLHAAGCWATGGSVTRLEIQPLYGGHWLAELFPFVVAGGEYAGRLAGFDTGGSDGVYLATDALPFLPTVLLGVPWLQACARRRRPFSLGPAAVLALAPFVSLTGDFYEMGAIVVTGLAGEGWEHLRADDLFALMGTLRAEGAGAGSWGLVAAGALLGTVLAFATYALGAGFARLLGGARRDRISR